MNEDEILKTITRAAAIPLARAGWKPLGTVQIVEWCGHGQEFIPVSADDGWCQVIPVQGEAT